MMNRFIEGISDISPDEMIALENIANKTTNHIHNPTKFRSELLKSLNKLYDPTTAAERDHIENVTDYVVDAVMEAMG